MSTNSCLASGVSQGGEFACAHWAREVFATPMIISCSVTVFSAQWARLYRECNPTLHEIFDRCIVVSNGTSTSQKHLFAAMRGCGGQANDTQLSHFMEKKFAKHPIVKKIRKKTGRVWEGLKLAETGDDYF